MSCFWSHNWEKWSEVFDVPWEAYGNSEQTFVRHYQRRECKDCGLIEERDV